MAHTASSSTGTRIPTQYTPETKPVTGWVGWIVFAATMMMIVGAFQAIQGLVALFKDTYYQVPSSGLVVQVDYTAWGWTHLVLGVLVFAAGVGLFTGQTWARVLGVIFASLSMLANFAFIAAFPFWSLLVIALDVFVIMAITVHGSELKSAAGEMKRA